MVFSTEHEEAGKEFVKTEIQMPAGLAVRWAFNCAWQALDTHHQKVRGFYQALFADDLTPRSAVFPL
jgi:hypothetical protein